MPAAENKTYKQKMKNKQGGVFSPLLISELEERTILLYDYYAQA